jgi:3'(2'), 5'-bisphosphate nucleotidase
MNDHELAQRLAHEAGILLLDVRRADVADRGAAGDWRSQAFLAQRLAAERPDDAVLSEESVDDGQRLNAQRVWIIDPLDGTREFGEPGRTDWAVHVALWERGALAAGAVALPAQGVTLATPDVALVPRTERGVQIVVSRTRAPRVAEAAATALGAELLQLGSAGAKVAAVIAAEADVYIHAGGQHEWDSAAPVAVARAAGLHESRLDGSPLLFNQTDANLPDLLICRRELADSVLAAVKEAVR